MTDIVEQAARVIYDTENYNRAVLEDAQVIAQALADAGLLAQPARTESSRIITDVQDLEMSLDRVVIRDADGDIWERQGELETERGTFAAWLGTHTGVKPSIDIPLPATVIYVPGEFTGERPTRQEVWQEAFSAGYMDGQSHTVPTREEIAEALFQWNTLDDPHFVIYGRSGDDSEGNAYYPIADAILALLADQPTVAEAKAQALEEAAELTDNPHEDYWLRERAQQIRGKQ